MTGDFWESNSKYFCGNGGHITDLPESIASLDYAYITDWNLFTSFLPLYSQTSKQLYVILDVSNSIQEVLSVFSSYAKETTISQLKLIHYRENVWVFYNEIKKQKSLKVIYHSANARICRTKIKQIRTCPFFRPYKISFALYLPREITYEEVADLYNFSTVHTDECSDCNNSTLRLWNNELTKTKEDEVLFITDETQIENVLVSKYSTNHLFYETVKLKKRNGIDYYYFEIPWAIYDAMYAQSETIEQPNTEDIRNLERFEDKKGSGYFDNRVIYIHEALGDNIIAWPLLLDLKDIYVRTCYPWLYEDLKHKLKGLWTKSFKHDSGSCLLGFNVYGAAGGTDAGSLREAYYAMNGETPQPDKLQYYPCDVNKIVKYREQYGNFVVIFPSASNYDGTIKRSNKTWLDNNWEEIVQYCKNKGLTVIQMGSSKDIMINNTDHKFLDMPISECAALIAASKFWIGLDTFLHHFATFVCKRGILLTPAHNELAEHKINYNLKMWPGKDWYYERYWKDYQQYLRKPSMELLHPQQVKNVIDEIVDNYNKKFKTI